VDGEDESEKKKAIEKTPQRLAMVYSHPDPYPTGNMTKPKTISKHLR
jgi:hypothetical protein